jgi:hypothetical protein
MEPLDVRRLAALDLHGVAGTRRRRRLIRAEFVLGAVGCTGLGVGVAVTARRRDVSHHRRPRVY